MSSTSLDSRLQERHHQNSVNELAIFMVSTHDDECCICISAVIVAFCQRFSYLFCLFTFLVVGSGRLRVSNASAFHLSTVNFNMHMRSRSTELTLRQVLCNCYGIVERITTENAHSRFKTASHKNFDRKH